MISRNIDPYSSEPLERQQINDCLHQVARHPGTQAETALLTTPAELPTGQD
jgi:hypothetical protein